MPYGYGSANKGSSGSSSRSYGPPGSSSRRSAPTHQPKAKAKTSTWTPGAGAPTHIPKKKTSTWTPGAGAPTHIPKKKKVTTHPAFTNRGIPQTNKFKKWIASKFKKPMIEYFYPKEHGDMYIGLQTGTIPTSNYHKDVTADYWKNVSKNWGEVHPALGAMVNVGAPAGTMIGGLGYDIGQGLARYNENPNKYLSSFQQDVKATQFEPEVKAALEARGVTDISGVDTIGGMKAIAAEKPIKSNLQRMAGSVEPLLNAWGIGNNLNYARGGLADLYRYGGFSG